MRHPGADQVCHFGHKLPSFIEYSKFQNIHFPWYREAKRRATEEAEMEEEEEQVEPERDLGSVRHTGFPIPSFIEVFGISIREFPRLVGRSCS